MKTNKPIWRQSTWSAVQGRETTVIVLGQQFKHKASLMTRCHSHWPYSFVMTTVTEIRKLQRNDVTKKHRRTLLQTQATRNTARRRGLHGDVNKLLMQTRRSATVSWQICAEISIITYLNNHFEFTSSKITIELFEYSAQH